MQEAADFCARASEQVSEAEPLCIDSDSRGARFALHLDFSPWRSILHLYFLDLHRETERAGKAS